MWLSKCVKIALIAVLPLDLSMGCADDKEKKYKLTYEVLKQMECVPFPTEADGCLCFGEIPPVRGVYAFWAPLESCDDPMQPFSDSEPLLQEEETDIGTVES